MVASHEDEEAENGQSRSGGPESSAPTTGRQSLNAEAAAKLDELRADYEAVTGRPFETFYCPVLYRDEEVDLCVAHLVNRAFKGSHRGWTIQRRDVDSFYGSVFEADFLSLQDRDSNDPVDALADARLSRSLRPEITVDDERVEFYRPTGPVPAQHSLIAVETPEGPIELALKMRPDELLSRSAAHWEIQINKDVRLASLASVLKAAHLTVFSMLGYRYALSAGGLFVGRTILGDFFSTHSGVERATVLQAGVDHFGEFANMARPLLGGTDMQGTAADGRLCFVGTKAPWAVLVVVGTGERRHSVLVPVLEDPDASAHFMNFLRTPTNYLAIRNAEWKGDHFAVATETDRVHWPEAKFAVAG